MLVIIAYMHTFRFQYRVIFIVPVFESYFLLFLSGSNEDIWYEPSNYTLGSYSVQIKG